MYTIRLYSIHYLYYRLYSIHYLYYCDTAPISADPKPPDYSLQQEWHFSYVQQGAIQSVEFLVWCSNRQNRTDNRKCGIGNTSVAHPSW